MSKNVNNDVSKVSPIPTLILGRSTIVFITMLIGGKIICFRALILPLKMLGSYSEKFSEMS